MDRSDAYDFLLPAARERFFWLGGQKFIKTSVQNAEDIKTRKTLIEFEH